MLISRRINDPICTYYGNLSVEDVFVFQCVLSSRSSIYTMHKCTHIHTHTHTHSSESVSQYWCEKQHTSSAESQKAVNAVHQYSLENQKGAITIDFMYSDSALLVLNKTSLNMHVYV